MIAKAIAEETANCTDVLCLPVIPFGASFHHKQFWGTIFISSGTFTEYVREVCLSLCYYGVCKIVIVNGYGGNLAVLTELARELREKEVFVSVFQWWPTVASAREAVVSELAKHVSLIKKAKVDDLVQKPKV